MQSDHTRSSIYSKDTNYIYAHYLCRLDMRNRGCITLGGGFQQEVVNGEILPRPR